MVVSALAFLAYLVWAAHTPGEPRTLRDFLFLLALSGIPFASLLYSVWWGMAWGEPADPDGRKRRLALAGLALGAASAAMLVLLLPLWAVAVEHSRWAACWIGSGMLMSAAAALCGLAGPARARRPALFSAVLLPFWLFSAGLLLKAALD